MAGLVANPRPGPVNPSFSMPSAQPIVAAEPQRKGLAKLEALTSPRDYPPPSHTHTPSSDTASAVAVQRSGVWGKIRSLCSNRRCRRRLLQPQPATALQRPWARSLVRYGVSFARPCRGVAQLPSSCSVEEAMQLEPFPSTRGCAVQGDSRHIMGVARGRKMPFREGEDAPSMQKQSIILIVE